MGGEQANHWLIGSHANDWLIDWQSHIQVQMLSQMDES